ncbi:hybrid sensor histidine kinase/response regulator [Geobacter argillaceus]|uniref:histidine kinase n=1 Tax=Geobacter argillaceus TaxID=345631 RepID=A0A562VPP8_9BACT|nr:hybrid sensor histidine kinase/response regulator [Geobacter argillaceus]TWJ19822.1 PAS domain S-box-containing protein [Geobacter argillaceus]
MSCSVTMSHEGAISILLVEDSPLHIEHIRTVLTVQDPRITLTVARTLAEGRARLQEFRPNLAIVDILLPDGRGIELLPPVREKTTFPIVMLTGQGDEKEAVDAMKAGAIDYLVKSEASLADMAHIVERALREWRHIAERRRAEETLRESEERFRSFFHYSAIGMVIISPDGRFLQSNPANSLLLGYTEKEMLRLNVRDITHPEDRPKGREVYEELRSGRRRSMEYEKRYLRKDGAVIWGYVTVAGVYDAQQKLVYFVGQMQDVTERKQAEEALRKSEARWRSVFTTAAAGLVIISHDGSIMQANPAMCRFLGYPEDELANLTVEEVTHPADRDKTSLHYDEIFAGQREVLHYEKRYLRKDGQSVWGHASVACVLDADTEPLYCIGLVQDITERVQMEEEIRKANRELDDFVQMVSHDLRTPLTPIIGYAELLQVIYRDRLDEQAKEYLAEIGRQGQRMLGLLEDLLSLARTGYLPPPAEPVDSNQVVQETLVGLASRLADACMTVETGLLPCIRVPRTVLLQVFDNLIGNAIRYAGPGGSIEVEGERLGTRVRFSVRDHGPGVPEEERSRIFDLFYRGSTGKEVEGTGVGLATVQKIAHLYGGRAWVEVPPGGGSSFCVEMVDETRQ